MPSPLRRTGRDQNETPITARECADIVEAMLRGLPPDEATSFKAMIAEMIPELDAANSAADARRRRRTRFGAQDRSLAQRGRDSASFAARFPTAAAIRFGGTGR